MTRLGSCSSRCEVRLTIGDRLGAGFGAVSVLEALAGELQHLDERQQERDGALGALVQVRRALAEAVAASRGRRVVDRGAEAVGARETRRTPPACVEGIGGRASRGTRPGTRARTPRRRSAARRRRGASRRARASPRSRPGPGDRSRKQVASRNSSVSRATSRLSASPRQRVRAPQRERQERVVVGQGGLEPAPVRGRLLRGIAGTAARRAAPGAPPPARPPGAGRGTPSVPASSAPFLADRARLRRAGRARTSAAPACAAPRRARGEPSCPAPRARGPCSRRTPSLPCRRMTGRRS